MPSSAKKRVKARVYTEVARPTQSNPISSRPVLMERVVRIADFKELEFEGRSLPMVFTERDWNGILEATGVYVYWDMVHEFYTQLVNVSSISTSWSVSLRGVRLTITPNEIASFLDLPRPVEGTESTLLPVNAMHRALTGIDVHHDNLIRQKDLLPFFQMLHLIVAANVNPQQHTTDLSIEQGQLLLNIARGVSIDLPNHIFQTIWSAAKSTSSEDGLPFGLLITDLLLDAGVKPRSDEKRHKPMGPIRLTEVNQTDVEERAYVRAAEEEDVADYLPLPLPRPSIQEAGTGSSSQMILPLWFDTMLLEINSRVAAQIDSQVAAQIAPMQRQLEGIDSRVKPRSDEKRHKPRGVIHLTKLNQTDVEEREYVRATEEEDVAELPLLQNEPLAKPSTQEDGKGSSSQKTLPLWFDTMLWEIDSRVAAQIAPMQRKLEGIDSRLALMELRLQGVESIIDN